MANKIKVWKKDKDEILHSFRIEKLLCKTPPKESQTGEWKWKVCEAVDNGAIRSLYGDKDKVNKLAYPSHNPFSNSTKGTLAT